MKKWETPSVTELEISETADKWTGIYRDGGYIGDGIISGHLSWDNPGDNKGNDNKPENPVESLSQSYLKDNENRCLFYLH